MSWNNVLPMWFWQLEHEHFLAESNCAFPQELAAGSMKVMPYHVTQLSFSTFKNHNENAMYSQRKQDKFDCLIGK
jgi:hypothetical protein